VSADNVVAVSRFDVVNGWRDHPHEGGVLIDVRDDRIVTDQLSMPQSPRITGDQVYALDRGAARSSGLTP
jgi:hypothetical protein